MEGMSLKFNETVANTSISIVVTCHSNYIPFLQECLDSIKNQYRISGKLLVLDGLRKKDISDVDLEDWEVLEVSTSNPNKNRNIALSYIKEDFVVFFDADNVMSTQYFANLHKAITANDKHETGLLFPSIQYCDKNMTPTRRVDPSFDFDEVMEPLYIDASSCWNVQALKAVGGFDENLNCLDDFDLCLRLCHLGWDARSSGDLVYMREHNLGRRSLVSADVFYGDLWKTRSVGIVSLFSGRIDILSSWFDYLEEVDLPPKNHIYVLDNSGDETFGSEIKYRFAKIKNPNFHGYTYIKYGKKADISGPYHKPSRHLHIALLYSKIFCYVKEELCLTFEEDVIPIDTGAIRKLSNSLTPCDEVGIVAAVYESPGYKDHACATKNMAYWGYGIPMDSITNKMIEVGFVGGGFTLYKTPLLKRPMIINYDIHPEGDPVNKEAMTGWDGNVCYYARQRGYKVLLDGSVRCDHIFRAGHIFPA